MGISVNVQDIARKFSLEIKGETGTIDRVNSLSRQHPNGLSWVKSGAHLHRVEYGFVVISSDIAVPSPKIGLTFLVTMERPRLVFAKIVQEYFPHLLQEGMDNCVEIHRRNKSISIGDGVFIGSDVQIGDGTVIHPGVVIYPRTQIGRNCVLRAHVSLGTEGLGLEMDPEKDAYVKFPQLGGVVLGDNVEIGPTSTVRRAALEDTVIGDGTKIGSLVNIGHNCVIGRNCILTCQIVTSGSSVIGDNVFMGVNSIVKQGVNIGSNSTVGQGAVVTRHVPDGETYVGNPAESIDEYRLWSAVRKRLISMFGDKDGNENRNKS